MGVVFRIVWVLFVEGIVYLLGGSEGRVGYGKD